MAAEQSTQTKQSGKPQQIPMDFALRPAMGREDFLIENANKAAAGWIDKWPDWPAPACIITGPAASGKTHLTAVWQDKSGASTINPNQLTSKTAEALRKNKRHLLLDGIDPWIGDKDAETTLFHLYNMAKEDGTSLLLTMRSSPAELPFALPDLASRLRAAPLAAIAAPDDGLLSAIMIKQFYDRKLPINHDMISYILPRMERSFAAARDIVEAADKRAWSEKRPLSIPLLREVLTELQNQENHD